MPTITKGVRSVKTKRLTELDGMGRENVEWLIRKIFLVSSGEFSSKLKLLKKSLVNVMIASMICNQLK